MTVITSPVPLEMLPPGTDFMFSTGSQATLQYIGMGGATITYRGRPREVEFIDRRGKHRTFTAAGKRTTRCARCVNVTVEALPDGWAWGSALMRAGTSDNDNVATWVWAAGDDGPGWYAPLPV